MRVSASSVISSVAETSATPKSCRADGARSWSCGRVYPFGLMMRSAVVWRRVFVASSILWALSLPLATRAAAPASASSAGYVFALAVYAIGSRICHQLPARSFHLWSMQMPVCARCAGIYAGAAVRRDRHHRLAERWTEGGRAGASCRGGGSNDRDAGVRVGDGDHRRELNSSRRRRAARRRGGDPRRERMPQHDGRRPRRDSSRVRDSRTR